MTKPITKPKATGLGWKHIVFAVVFVWLLLDFVGGEKLKLGSFELTVPGCSLKAKEFQRDVSGLSLKPLEAKSK